jgi:hypothetical protein
MIGALRRGVGWPLPTTVPTLDDLTGCLTSPVSAKLSSWPDAQSPAMLHDPLNTFDAVGAALAGLATDDGTRRPGPPGVVVGLSRGRIGGSPTGIDSRDRRWARRHALPHPWRT